MTIDKYRHRLSIDIVCDKGDTMIKVQSVALTHVGKVRSENQDNVFCSKIFFDQKDIDRSYKDASYQANVNIDVVAVFDGMGGENDGSVAATIAAQTLDEIYENYGGAITDVIKANHFISEYFHMANTNVCKFMNTIQGRSGATAALLLLTDGQAVCANLGDSRVYLYRNQSLVQVSMDHTELQVAIKAGIDFKRGKGKLVQHLGIYESELVIEPYVKIVKIEANDRFIVCSDGLTDMISDDILEGYCQLELPLDRLANILLNVSLENGGKDNISIIIYDIVGESVEVNV